MSIEVVVFVYLLKNNFCSNLHLRCEFNEINLNTFHQQFFFRLIIISSFAIFFLSHFCNEAKKNIFFSLFFFRSSHLLELSAFNSKSIRTMFVFRLLITIHKISRYRLALALYKFFVYLSSFEYIFRK